MRQSLTILLLLFSFINLKAQTNSTLESKRGFKDFVLGTNVSKYSGQLSYVDIVKGENHYIYTGSCCQTMLDYDVDKVELYFKENLLITIKISLKPLGQDTEKFDNAYKILYKFSDNFGKAKESGVKDGNTIFRYSWVSKTVSMVLNIGYYDFNIGFIPEIFIMNNNNNSNIDF